jgi:hypothetical protein
MQRKATHTAAGSRGPAHGTWVTPRVTRLAATEAELGIVGIGPDAERIS